MRFLARWSRAVLKKSVSGFKTHARPLSGRARSLFLVGILGALAFGRASASEPMMDGSVFEETRTGASSLVRLGRFDRALQLEQTALKIAQDQYGPTSLFLVPIQDDVAVLQWRLAEYRDSEQGLKWGLALAEKNAGPDDLAVADSLDLLAGLYYDLDRLAEAEGLEKRALALRRSAGTANSQALPRTEDLLGQVELGLKKISEAQTLFREAQKSLGRSGKPDPAFSILLLKHLALACASGNEFLQSQSCLEKALETAQKVFKSDSPEAANAMEDLADFYGERGHPEKARPLWESALKTAGRLVGGVYDYQALPRLKNLARAEGGVGDHPAAADLWLKILPVDKAVYGEQHPQVALDLMALADQEEKLGQPGKAAEELKESLSILRRLFPAEDPLVRQADSRLEALSR